MEEQEETQLCAGCGDKIYDRYYLSAIDKLWHQDCLRCSSCQRVLDGETSCFFRDGDIFCRNDYHRKFQQHTCTRCRLPIDSSDLVMRARELVFHVNCFVCNYCHMPLEPGQEYGSIMNAVYCRVHFEMMDFTGAPASTMIDPQSISSVPMTSHNCTNKFSDYYTSGTSTALFDLSSATAVGPQDTLYGSAISPYDGSTVNSSTSGPSIGQGRGRPRKRKSSTDLTCTSIAPVPADSVGMTGLYDSYGYPITNMDISCLSPTGSSYQQMSSGRQKRIRTSFKTTQLRVMKAYFGHNHNPDAKDLKVLASRTGLSKRVLQVWFQNARAKLRRSENTSNAKGKDQLTTATPATTSESKSVELRLETDNGNKDDSNEEMQTSPSPNLEIKERLSPPLLSTLSKQSVEPILNNGHGPNCPSQPQEQLMCQYSLKSLPLRQPEFNNNMVREIISKNENCSTSGGFEVAARRGTTLLERSQDHLINNANNFGFLIPPGPGGPGATPAEPDTYLSQESVV